ncbi:putative transcriptional regulator [Thermanaerovibrio velox DSM 12556]|uniref:Putative transcriptional regulator n=1 Tax=Thermanaerovibrio velox DSM 12556 TaxID=926567 RepID=H0UQN9_9BACT|nr:metalloregulator ArsR/SmtB family transcription factor [Thermanaerovibrio velox]EHM10803.1 putative transcriptional regulator [Thermanaerovibrio velox DSM 12556]
MDTDGVTGFDPRVEVLKALAHPVRLRILEALGSREMCVCQISDLFPFDRTTISKHLSLMKEAGILYCRKEGLNVYYGLRMTCLVSLVSCIGRLSSVPNGGNIEGCRSCSCG